MIDRRGTKVVQIPIAQINVVNPRSRGKTKFKQITTNIANVGLKKPITVVARGIREGKQQYDLVCGQGRLEAYLQLGEQMIPALIIEATREELMLMSLAENLARRRQTTVELLREIASLKERGYPYSAIARKTDLHESYVKGITRLLKHGENKLIQAVEHGRIPLSVAVTIATSDDGAVQAALAEAYESNNLRGNQLLRARKLIEQRRNAKKLGSNGKSPNEPKLNGDRLLQVYMRESAKQRQMVQKAKVCETRLLFIASALKQLFADESFLSILRSAGLDRLPEYLAAQIGQGKA